MSGERGDCPHGHASAVMDIARTIGEAHGVKADSAALVIFDPKSGAPFVVGKFNTAALGSMADAMLSEVGRHDPDGCPTCDPMAIACHAAARFLREEFAKQQAAYRGRQN